MARSFVAGLVLAALHLLGVPGRAQTPQTFNACYVPSVGAIYLVGLTGLPGACLGPTHVAISWAQGGTLADGAVTTPKLADGAVTAAKIAPAAVGSTQLNPAVFAGPGAAETAARSDHTHAAAGTDNTAVGRRALETPMGGGNTAVGAGALLANTTGFNNTAVGWNTLVSATIACCNTAVGQGALQRVTAGENTAVGLSALLFNTSGQHNTAVGVAALQNNVTGSRNIAIGHTAGISATGSNNIYIGNVGAAAEASTIRVGDVQARVFIAGIRGVTTGVADAVPVLIASDGQLGTVSSSRRFKEDIHDMADVSQALLRLRPVAFRYRQPAADGLQPLQYGLIAEEVAEVLPELVVYDSTGQPETVRYHVLPAMLLNELQRQERELAALRQVVEELRAELRRIRR